MAEGEAKSAGSLLGVERAEERWMAVQVIVSPICLSEDAESSPTLARLFANPLLLRGPACVSQTLATASTRKVVR